MRKRDSVGVPDNLIELPVEMYYNTALFVELTDQSLRGFRCPLLCIVIMKRAAHTLKWKLPSSMKLGFNAARLF